MSIGKGIPNTVLEYTFRDWKSARGNVKKRKYACHSALFSPSEPRNVQGPILAFIYAVKELLEEGKASQGSLPVNVAFVFEGEEENGSVGFEEAIQGNLHWFEGTQLIVISNTLWVGERVPCLTYGMLHLEIKS